MDIVPTSATTGEGIADLLQLIIQVTQVLSPIDALAAIQTGGPTRKLLDVWVSGKTLVSLLIIM